MKKDKLIEKSIIAIAVLLTVSAVYVRTSDVPKPTGTEVIYVHSGQTLWDIADEYCPAGVDKREWITQVQKHNNLRQNQDKISIHP